MAHKKLEQYKWFPVVAWTLAIGFAAFVSSLALELRNTADGLRETSISLEQRMQYLERKDEENDTSTHESETQ